MPCGCGKTSAQRRAARHIVAGPPNGKGSYPLATYPDCTTAYSDGPFAGESTIVVGRLTGAERLFRRTLFEDASNYSLTVPGSGIENIPNAGLCAAAVEAAWA